MPELSWSTLTLLSKVELSKTPPCRVTTALLVSALAAPRIRLPPFTKTEADAKDPVSAKTPPVTDALPLCVFAPDRVSRAGPDLMNAAAPLSTPANIASLATASVVSCSSVAFPLNVNNPLRVASPTVILPVSNKSLASVRAVEFVLETVLPESESRPVPSAVLLPTCKTPVPSTTPPLKSLAPLSAIVPAVTFTKPPAPEIAPSKTKSFEPRNVREPPARFSAPEPVSELMLSLDASLSVAPESTATAMVSVRAAPF